MSLSTSPSQGISARGASLLATAIVFLVVDLFIIGIRFLSRHLKRQPFGWDDWFIVIGWLFYGAQTALNFFVIFEAGLGFHSDQVSLKQEQNMLMELTLIQYPYALDLLFVRFSICALFLRIFPQRWMRITIWTLVCIDIAWCLFIIIATFPVCVPFTYNWDQTTPGGHCNLVAQKNTYIANAIWTILYDFTIWSIPQLLVWRLQMPRVAKLALSAVFALGIVDIVISIVRITTVLAVDFKDLSYSAYSAQTWSLAEVFVAIAVACLPICGHVVVRILPHGLVSRIKNSTMSRGGRLNEQNPGLETIGGGNHRSNVRTTEGTGVDGGRHKFRSRRDQYGVLDDDEVELGPLYDSRGTAVSASSSSPEFAYKDPLKAGGAVRAQNV